MPAVVDAAIAEARRRDPLQEPSLFEFVRSGPAAGSKREAPGADAIPRTPVRSRRSSSSTPPPVSAKGLEDTAFYNDVLLLLRQTKWAAISSGARRRSREFHDEQPPPARRLAARDDRGVHARHQTRRGRARAHSASSPSSPTNGDSTSRAGRRSTDTRTPTSAARSAPDRNDEWMFYQALVGAWPAERPDALVPGDRGPPSSLSGCGRSCARRSRRPSVTRAGCHENPEYERRRRRVRPARPRRTAARRFLSSFVPFTRRAGLVRHARVARAGGAATRRARRARHLSGLGALEPRARRSRQSPAGRSSRAAVSSLTSLEPILAGPTPRSLSPLLDAVGRRPRQALHNGCRTAPAAGDPNTFLKGDYVPLGAERRS